MALPRSKHHAMLAQSDRLRVAVDRDMPHGQKAHPRSYPSAHKNQSAEADRRCVRAAHTSNSDLGLSALRPRIEDDHGAPDGWTGIVKMARVVWSGPNLSALSMASSSESRLRARWTRLLIVPTAVSQIAAASSYEKPDAPTRSRASRWTDGSLASASRNSSNSTRLCCSGGDFRLSRYLPSVSWTSRRRFRYSDRNRLRRMVSSQAHMFVPGWNELMLPMARRSVSCTRSSARSTLPQSEIANARKLGTAASMASRTSG